MAQGKLRPGHLQYPVSIWFVCSTSELQQCQPREFLFLIVSLSSPPFLPFHWLSHLSGYLRLSISLISLIFKHAHVHSEMYYCSRFTIFGMFVSQMYGIICIGRLFYGFLAVPSLLFSPWCGCVDSIVTETEWWIFPYGDTLCKTVS